jgi:LmbE family N-acetylglucosaminyl deacetylase
MSEDHFPIERAMVVHAHPDDAEFGCAGTVAKLASRGVEVTLVVATNGDAGGEGDRTHEQLRQVREQEQRAAADILGIKNVVNLGYPDGYLTPSLELRKDITRQIRRHRPNLVITANPVRNLGPIYGNHPDHLAVGEATLAAVYPTARNPMAVPELLEKEGLDKWVVDWVYIVGTALAEPNHYEDITDFIEQKKAALLVHESQLGPEVGEYQARANALLAREAQAKGYGEMEYAEEFYKLFTGALTSEDARRLAFPRRYPTEPDRSGRPEEADTGPGAASQPRG